MSSLQSIPVTVNPTDTEEEKESALLAVLHQIESMLETLLASGETDAIDLRRAPLTQGEVARIRTLLGCGSLLAEFTEIGRTTIQETGIYGVWWITHFSVEGKVLGEFVEVTGCPALLMTSTDDIEGGRRKLHDRIDERLHAISNHEISQRLQSMGIQSPLQTEVE